MLSNKLSKAEVDMFSRRISSVLMFCYLLTAGQGLANHHEHHDHHKHETKKKKHNHHHDHHDHKKNSDTSNKSHVHGEGKLNFVVEGQKLVAEFELSADDVLGFEHKPKTDAQKKKLTDALALLTKDLVSVKGCAQSNAASITSDLLNESPKTTHADFVVTQTFSCKDSSKIDQIEVKVFSLFPKLTKLRVQGVLEKSSVATTVSPKNTSIKIGK